MNITVEARRRLAAMGRARASGLINLTPQERWVLGYLIERHHRKEPVCRLPEIASEGSLRDWCRGNESRGRSVHNCIKALDSFGFIEKRIISVGSIDGILEVWIKPEMVERGAQQSQHK